MSLTSALPLLAVVALALYRSVRNSPSVGSKVGSVLAILVGIAPAIWVMAARGVSSKLVLGYGVLFFIVSVLVKWAVYLGVLSKHVHPRMGAAVGGIVQGVLSAASEMGVAVIAFLLVVPNLSPWQVFGFGAGAAALEATLVSLIQNPHAGTANGEHVAAQFAKIHAAAPWFAAVLPFVERSIATTDHIACRGLVAVGVASGRVWPAALALMAFAATDGFVWYCLGRRWEFAQPQVAAKLYGVLALVAVSCAVAWALTA